MLRLGCLLVVLAWFPSSAGAQGAADETSVTVTFVESAPKDSFTIANVGKCKAHNLQLRINLATSQGRLIFDPTGQGAGVEVFQPLQVTNGQAQITSISQVSDGSQDVELRLTSLAPGSIVSFTVDVDDTLPRDRSELGQIRVSGSEISGAEVQGQVGEGGSVKAIFGSDATARLARVSCAQT